MAAGAWGILAFGCDLEFGAATCRKHQDAQNGFGICLDRIVESLESDGAMELTGNSHEVGSSTSMET